ncbi:MAG: tetratricopeptide repeat protein [Acidobacteriota bacterium]
MRPTLLTALVLLGLAVSTVARAQDPAAASATPAASPSPSGVEVSDLPPEPAPAASPTPSPSPSPSPSVSPAASPAAPAPSAESQAELKYAQGDLEGAAQLYSAAADQQSQIAEKVRLLVVAASIEHELGHADHALDAMTRALALQPDYVLPAGSFAPSLQDVYYEGRRRALEARAAQAHDKVASGQEKTTAGDWTGARADFEAALALDASLPEAIFGLAQVDYHEGRNEPAIAGFQRVLALQRANPDAVPTELRFSALNNLGILFYRRGFYEDAETALAEAVTVDAKQASAWSNLGLARYKLGKRAAALEALGRAHQLDPADEATTSNLALAYIDAADWTSAVALLSTATKTTPGSALLWLNLGVAQKGMGNLEGALISLARAEALDSRDAQGIAHRAAAYLSMVHLQQGKLAEATADAQRQLVWQPEDPDGWMNFGQAQLASGDAASALTSFQKALALDPARPEISNNLGSAFYQLGEYAKARDSFQRALAMRQGYRAAQDNLKLASQRLAELDEIEQRLGLLIDAAAGKADGMHVRGTRPASPAARAELLPGDVILQVEGEGVASAGLLCSFLDAQPPRRSLAFQVRRGQKVFKAKLRLP